MANGRPGATSPGGSLFPSPDPATLAESERFALQIERRRQGEISEEEFRRYRLNNGVYGIRGQQDVQMIRVKIPFGTLTARQANELGNIAEEFAPRGIGHITTRQCIQYHLVPLEQVPDLMRRLGEVGLTSREACGNTVRNVTGCPLAGVCRDEVFDITPYAAAYVRYFIRNPKNQNLPRKFKTSFSGCAKDCAMSAIHDIGAVAAVREVDGRIERGFRVYVGGGLGSFPRAADLLEEFTPLDQFFLTAEAIMRVFDLLGERKNMHRNRMKFLINDLGIEEFRDRVFKERRLLGAVKAVNLFAPDLTAVAAEPAAAEAGVPPGVAPGVAPAGVAEIPDGGDKTFRRWLETNVVPQKQEGYFVAYVTVPGGDLDADQFRLLGSLSRRYADGHLVTTVSQDLLFRYVRGEDLAALYEQLAEAGLGLPGVGHVLNVTGCPGAETCNLAITRSHRMALELHRSLAARPEYGLADDLKGVTIKVSGCPNSCGQHHIGTIGLFGNATRIGDHQVPLYLIQLGGEAGEERVSFSQPLLRVPVKRIPEAIFRLFDLYRAQRREGETFQEWAGRVNESGAKEAPTG